MIKKLFSSLFTKLLFIVLLSAVVLNILLYSAFSYFMRHGETGADRERVHYISYLRNELGDTPSRENAERLAKTGGITVSYSSPSGSWTAGRTDGNFPDFKFHIRQTENGIETGTLHGYSIAKITEGDSEIIFRFWPAEGETERLKIFGRIILVSVFLLMTAVYLLIRRLLKPLNSLSASMEEVKKGNYDNKINKKGNDELAQLCTVFDSLTSEISSSIKAKEKLLTDISHELRTPLASMRIAAEMVKDDELRTDMTDDIKQMDKLINLILESSRIKHGALKITPTDFNALAGEIAGRFRQTVFIPCSDLPLINIDSKSVELAVRNIIENALKYSEDDVLAEVIVRNGYAGLKVTDRGIGIAQKDLELITEPFYRADESRSKTTGGIGLGLNICKRTAEAHGGQLIIESRQGAGTSVYLLFPSISRI